ncbi:hypothetical protein M9Y10_004999 [Tritrichomonas musculus]|uniref:Protein kinase domain-containing protein n=1 Tax=Tritrichomonas musculus TaxID=1915356 RepID=A0ABR2JKK5_9EUKA
MQEPNKSQQCIGNYVIEGLIGEGSYTKIFKARHITLQCFVALKVFSKESPNKAEIMRHFNTEMAILSKLKHPFIIELFEVIENDHCKAMVLEYIEKGTLLSYINKVHKIKEETSKRIYSQLISIFTYLHEEMKIVHCDIKLENILIDRHNNIRLIDFGFASEFVNSSPQLTQTNGSPSYVAPEIIKGYKYNSAVDIWSSGIILYILLVGKLPFFGDTISSQLNNILVSEPEIPQDISQSAKDLIMKLLIKDPLERISLFDIKKHRWIMMECNDLQQLVSSCQKYYNKPDKEIFSLLQECGLPITGLMSKLLGNTSVCKVEQEYYILRRAKISDLFSAKKYQSIRKTENLKLETTFTLTDDISQSRSSRPKKQPFKEANIIISPTKRYASKSHFTPQLPKQVLRRYKLNDMRVHQTFEDV